MAGYALGASVVDVLEPECILGGEFKFELLDVLLGDFEFDLVEVFLVVASAVEGDFVVVGDDFVEGEAEVLGVGGDVVDGVVGEAGFPEVREDGLLVGVGKVGLGGLVLGRVVFEHVED